MEDDNIGKSLYFFRDRKDLFEEHSEVGLINKAINSPFLNNRNYAGTYIFNTINYYVFSAIDYPESHGIIGDKLSRISVGYENFHGDSCDGTELVLKAKHPYGYVFAVPKKFIKGYHRYGKSISIHKIYDNWRFSISMEKFLEEIKNNDSLTKYILFNVDIDFYVPRLTSAIC